jgi:CBS domain-containing protein
MNVKEIMTGDPVCCTPDDTIAAAARLMADHDCGCIPVVESADQCVIGVITDRDIAVRGVAQSRSTDTQVRELMSPSLYCCRDDASIDEVENMMADHQVRRVVIVDECGCCAGIVAQADLARAAERKRTVTDEEVARVVERISEPRSETSWRL